jgi:hypothetical protein
MRHNQSQMMQYVLPLLLNFSFQIFHEQPNDWKLQIQFPNLDDSGVYECLVSTNPPLVRRTRLTVIGKNDLQLDVEEVENKDFNSKG